MIPLLFLFRCVQLFFPDDACMVLINYRAKGWGGGGMKRFLGQGQGGLGRGPGGRGGRGRLQHSPEQE